MTSLIGKDKSCGPDEVKKCKEPKKISVEKPPDCVEPVAPEYKERVLFSEDSTDPVDQERAKCLYDCAVEPYYTAWKDCEKRVTRKLLYTAETCHDETIELMEALDKCVGDIAFKRLM